MFRYYIYKFGQFVVNRLPLKVSYCIAVFLSDMHYFLSFRDRRAVKSNLKNFVSCDNDIPRLAREVFRNFGKYLVEFFWMAKHMDSNYIKKNVKIKNIEHIDNIKKEGKGAIFLTSHMGNWEMGAAIVSIIGYPSMVIALPHKARPVNDLFNQQRQAHGITVVPTSVAIRKCVEGLREGKFVALIADRDFSMNGEVMDFLGKTAFIPKGPAAFSIKTGVPIVPVFLVRGEDDTFTLSFHEPFYPPRSGDKYEMLLDVMKKYISITEDMIKKYPDQWLMFREFWVE